jgi:cell division protein FtsB
MPCDKQSQPKGLSIKIMTYFRSRPAYAKEVYYLICLVLVVVISLFSIWGPGGYIELRKARSQLEAQRVRVEALRQSNAERLLAIQSLRSDPNALEKYARSKNYAQKGEIVQQLPQEPPSKK